MDRTFLLKCAAHRGEGYLPPKQYTPTAEDMCDVVDILIDMLDVMPAENRAFYGIIDGLTVGMAIGWHMARKASNERAERFKPGRDRTHQKTYLTCKGYPDADKI